VAASFIIAIGGDPPSPSVVPFLPVDDAVVIAADSGFDHAVRLGLTVDVLVGDLDSISAEGLALAHQERDAGRLTIERHRPDKDFTDTELAVGRALASNATRIVGLSGGGNRIDHQLGTLAAFAGAAVHCDQVELWWASDHIRIINGPAEASWTTQADRRPGQPMGRDDGSSATPRLVSLVPFGGRVEGVSTQGLEYSLTDATLRPDSALGISNVATHSSISVSMTTGILLIITPGVLS
jgi:thiamine pyrophosphokinase